MCSSLKGRSVFHHEPKEAPFHVGITFPNNIDLSRNNKRIGIVFAEGLDDSTKACSERIAMRHYLDLLRVHFVEGMHSKQGSHNIHIGCSPTPEEHFNTIVQQEDAITGQSINT